MFITPVPRTSVQGRSEYSFVRQDGTQVPAGRTFAKTATKRYSFPSTIDGTALNTGLNRMVSNPWYNRNEDDINEGLPEYFHVGADWMSQIKRITKSEKITKQLELEIRFNLDEGHLTNKKLLRPEFKSRSREMNDPFNFLETFKIILYDRPNRFDDTTLRGALAQELAKVSGKIAKTKSKANPSRHHFYISEENEAAIERTARQDIVNDAVTDLTLLRRNHSPFVSYQVAVILKKVKGTVAPVVVKDELNNFVATKNNSQLDNIKEFNKLNSLINEGAEGISKMWIMYLIQQALNTNIMSLKAGEYIWHSKKGIDNLYNLGSNVNSVHKLFLSEFNKYQGTDDVDNWYNELLKELKTKGVKLEE